MKRQVYKWILAYKSLHPFIRVRQIYILTPTSFYSFDWVATNNWLYKRNRKNRRRKFFSHLFHILYSFFYILSLVRHKIFFSNQHELVTNEWIPLIRSVRSKWTVGSGWTKLHTTLCIYSANIYIMGCSDLSYITPLWSLYGTWR